MSISSYADAMNRFDEFDRPAVIAKYGNGDEIAMSEAWNDFTDMLCKDGDMTDLQYHYCPAVDDNCDMDDEETLEFILEQMGFKFSHGPLRSTRNDGLMSKGMTRHYSCNVSRGSHAFEFWYSQGRRAHTSANAARRSFIAPYGHLQRGSKL